MVRSLAESRRKNYLNNTNLVLTGYVMLAPKEGWQFLLDILKERSGQGIGTF